ncbi:AAA family ATPase [Enterococcus columbae]|uniref:Uncharacterized protein n=1 Tax=Enterococcus columbae DSM 7374 = ATCC 51263 TaxID=1121865 RepID=S1NHB5_9ENTE|nr:AAA family ATPase [Enterococcus columbae]EOT40433.1 hypothetical protein OMW_01295 [Enterococcus columbae DSM 7374 = ATCC 51263]EOW80209.1 hypothetical protein I568_01909 [Enterococcus columbae DSM 7374 = ATCC 51263]OJG21829.1 hypothetical protein RR47_GL001155 [Enterococcus columbae DSM 7374 = ATCC 51263]
MYLKSLSVRNYRKYGDSGENIFFAHSSCKENIKEYLSNNSTLIVGANNSGKSTIITLLSKLEKLKSGSRSVFAPNDFNYQYIKSWFDNNVYKAAINEQSLNIEATPEIEFILTIGVEDKNENIYANFFDVLVINENTNLENMDIKIKFKYELVDEKAFKNNLDKLVLKSAKAKEKKGKQEFFREFVKLLNGDHYALNVYPDGSDTKVKNFSLSSLFNVKTIAANTVKSDEVLSKAYNKIVQAYIKKLRMEHSSSENQHENSENLLEKIDNFIIEINSQLNTIANKKIKEKIQEAVSSIESAKNLEMNLQPNVTIEKLLSDGILYEYVEDNSYIPESQFGMGYTNLMVIIANIVDYIHMYDKEKLNSSINILCIEEPETFMHPQMQELFIRNISSAMDKLIGNTELKKSFQIVITTHSSYILSSKISSENSFNNIVYVRSGRNKIFENEDDTKSFKQIINLYNEELQEELRKKRTDNLEIDNVKMRKYIAKYVSLELIDIFFADAVIFVEGSTEEMYIKYLISKDDQLSKLHIKVFVVGGAYAHLFSSLLKLLGIKSIIYTDLDIKKDIGKNNILSSNLDDSLVDLEMHSTNSSLKTFYSSYDKKHINEDRIGSEESKDYIFFPLNNISVYSQGKINGKYATSFEEAIILSNCEENKNSLIKILSKILPKDKELYKGNIKNHSREIQIKLASKKREFALNMILFLSTDSEFRLKIPIYIKKGLEELGFKDE